MITNHPCAAWFQLLREWEAADDQGATRKVVPLDLASAGFHPAAGELADGGSDGGAGESSGTGALADRGEEADSITHILENALLNPLFQRQAT